MTSEQLVAYCPRLYHLTATVNVESILRNGLLSVTALLNRFGIAGPERDALEASRRAKTETLSHVRWGTVQVRDQHPLSVRGLERALRGTMTVEAWLRLINGRVFFFPDQERLERLAGAYQHESQSILVVDTRRLVEMHAAAIELSHMNTGATAPAAHPRGPDTFRPLGEYPFDERRRRFGRRGALAEVTVRYAVPDIRACLLEVGAAQR